MYHDNGNELTLVGSEGYYPAASIHADHDNDNDNDDDDDCFKCTPGTQATQLMPESQDNSTFTPKDPLVSPKPRPIGKLMIVSGNETTDQELYVDSTIVVGRHRTCDIRFQSDFCSNKHCVVMVAWPPESSKPAVMCEDLSTNGTFWNGRKIGKGNKVVLSQGDTLEVKKGNYITLLLTRNTRSKNGAAGIVNSATTANGEFTVEYTMTESEEYDAISNKYHITEDVLGSGTYAQVKLAMCKSSRQQLAVKVIDRKQMMGSAKRPSIHQPGNQLQNEEDEATNKAESRFLQEISIMRAIEHPNIVRVLDVHETRKQYYIFMPLVSGGDLFDYIMERDKLAESEARFIFYQIALALKHLHERNISHRDVKPENCLLSNKSKYPRALLTDFGMATVVAKEKMMQTFCGTFQYIAPEVIKPELSGSGDGKDSGYGKGVDCWSLGVLLYAMLSGTLPFSEVDGEEGSLFRQILAGRAVYPDDYWSDVTSSARGLVASLLVVNPHQRMTVAGIFTHPWITDNIESLNKLYQENVMPSVEKEKELEQAIITGTSTKAAAATTTGSHSTVDAKYQKKTAVVDIKGGNSDSFRMSKLDLSTPSKQNGETDSKVATPKQQQQQQQQQRSTRINKQTHVLPDSPSTPVTRSSARKAQQQQQQQQQSITTNESVDSPPRSVKRRRK
ncbi:kinase-like protein [Ramicandelaber brevisporus]|nr:kinase-like protein [Ramicandelaber brevisporus]